MAAVERPTPPDVLRALVDRVRARNGVRVTDLRPVERGSFAAATDRSGRDDPALRVAVLEADVTGSARELVRHPVRVRRVEDGVSTVAVDDLSERAQVACVYVRPGPVVLRSAEDAAWVERIDRDVDELDRAAQVRVDM